MSESNLSGMKPTQGGDDSVELLNSTIAKLISEQCRAAIERSLKIIIENAGLAGKVNPESDNFVESFTSHVKSLQVSFVHDKD